MRAVIGAVVLCVGCEPASAPADAGVGADGGLADAGAEPFDAGCPVIEINPIDPCTGAAASCTAFEADAADAIERALIDARGGCTSRDDCTLVGQVQVSCPFAPAFFEAWCPVAVLKANTCDFNEALAAASQATCERCREGPCDSEPSCPPTEVVCREGVCVAEVR